jgi:hypothetical protein
MAGMEFACRMSSMPKAAGSWTPHTLRRLLEMAVLTSSAGCQDRPLGLVEPLATTHVSLYVDTRAHTEKFDLSFVIDNSSSMADKEPWLGRAVADLVERLVNPPCVSADGTRQYYPEDPGAPCAEGEREMEPLRDVHLGFISTSLGGHGHETHCESPETPNGNDRGHLLPTVRHSNLDTYQGKGFLAWDDRLDALRDRAGTRDVAALRKSVEAIVESAGSEGCGYEEPLEAWYRFLVDPEPALRVVQHRGSSTKEGVDRELLDQRAAFLRPDSMVAIVMIADENDCSVRDAGPAYKLGNDSLAPGTSACAVDPNDPCCFSCDDTTAAVPEGCQPPSADPACGEEPIRATNTACFDQKRRFGIDFLYPTSRYVTALQDTELCPDSTFPDADCSCRRALELGVPCDPGEPMPNPLFVDSRPIVAWGRYPEMVSLVGIVGVPWQDVADPISLWHQDDNVLELARPPTSPDWELILGRPEARGEPSQPPRDALMLESVAPRLAAQLPRVLAVGSAGCARVQPTVEPRSRRHRPGRRGQRLRRAGAQDGAGGSRARRLTRCPTTPARVPG